RLIVALEVRVAVEDQKNRTEERQRLAQRTAGAQSVVAVVRIVHPFAEGRSVADDGFDLIAEMADTKDHVRYTVTSEQFELMGREGLAADVDERLGPVFRQRPETGRQSTGKNGDRQHQEKRTLVPSKSNRNRTSSSPACFIASRTGRCCSA